MSSIPSKSINITKNPTYCAKKSLDDALLNAEVDFIDGKNSKLSNEHIIKKHNLTWETTNDLSGKNSGSSVKIKGVSKGKKARELAITFSKLFGNAPFNYLPHIPPRKGAILEKKT